MSSRRNLLKTPHVVHVCVYHVVWATKYRRKVLDLRNTPNGPTVSDRLKQIVEEIAGENQWRVRAIETCGCGARLDRDYNAAVNIMVAAGLAETQNACGADIRLALARAVSVEAGTRWSDKGMSA